ncbi:coenzyme F390 synthetase [Sulfobacillus acidophilus TPY]|uniref:AMP-dependent synthetase/ligase domain-containing protein n=1 Tax=Sulfobacillus acidophilus (strain ATCC 700253 / DSM 10332 / NAL) TaxID=679936 RepID=G8TSK0_SULAD|nr:coenzyme F390 synthetase [Sulfobacillus acidophilus TPY]AEW06692.1 hypothetical protein Sulac_3246 [Sulfobacillus acidophilus DSM 10332]
MGFEQVTRREDWINRPPGAAAGAGRLFSSRGTVGDPLWWFWDTADRQWAATEWARRLSTWDIDRGPRMVIGLSNQGIAEGCAAGGEALGMVSAQVPEHDLIEAISRIEPSIVVTTPLSAFRLDLAGWLRRITTLVLTGDVTGRGRLVTRLKQRNPGLHVYEVYTLTEYPGPLAWLCSHGYWHWDVPELSVWGQSLVHPGLAGPGEWATVILDDAHHRSYRLQRYDTEDVVRVGPVVCPCQTESPWITEPVTGRRRWLAVLGGHVRGPADLAWLLYGTEGLGDRFRVTIQARDEGGPDELGLDVTVLPGYEADEVRDRLRYTVRHYWGVAADVRVMTPRDLLPSLQMQFIDARIRPPRVEYFLDDPNEP